MVEEKALENFELTEGMFAKPDDLTAHMKDLYENGQAKIEALQDEIATLKKEIKGARAYLKALGLLPKPPAPAGGKPRGRPKKQTK